MLAGVLPFRGDAKTALMYPAAHQLAPDSHTLSRALSDKLAGAVSLALHGCPATKCQDGE